jgi:tetratricopeptide (TPR) repeat protein
LKPILVFFSKGDKDKGIEQLRRVALNAFYTRTEAQYFLMRILSEEKMQKEQAIQVAEYLHQSFPDNPYFHRYYTRLLYYQGHFQLVKEESLEIIAKIDSGKIGYEEISGRYASFFLGEVMKAYRQDEEARHYYERAVAFAEAIDAEDSGYYHYSMLSLAEFALEDGREKEAKRLVKKIRKSAKRSSHVHQRARDLI